MSKHIGTLEMVLFEAKEGLSYDEVLTSLSSLNDILPNYDGFQGRKLSRDDTGTWMDLVYWTDLNAAKSAAEQVMKDPRCAAAFSVINESTLDMRHFDLQNEFVKP